MLKEDDYLILLDEKGKMISSEELAALLNKMKDTGTKTAIILIGGAFGVSDAILKRANFVWSLSKLVFPHQIVRLILAEQVYRAYTILNNGKYHHQ